MVFHFYIKSLNPNINYKITSLDITGNEISNSTTGYINVTSVNPFSLQIEQINNGIQTTGLFDNLTFISNELVLFTLSILGLIITFIIINYIKKGGFKW